MHPGNAGVCLSALFIDFDNIYLSLKNRHEEAASRFARNPAFWLRQVVTGSLIRTEHPVENIRRKIAVGRCYGNPIPRRSGREGSGDPSSFAFVRHSFMRAGLEVVDCPHLTSQFKNSSDIRIACDIRDYIDHATHFDEFIILSGDADFTPVLLSLRSHNRQTVIYANDHTSPYYKAFSDGRIREEDLIRCLLAPDAALTDEAGPAPASLQFVPASKPAQPSAPGNLSAPSPAPALSSTNPPKRRPAVGSSEAAIQSLIDDFQVIGDEILELVRDVIESSEKPVPLAYLADRAQKTLGHPKTIGTNWAGSGGFLNFLSQNLHEHLCLTEKPPHFVYDPARHRLREDLRGIVRGQNEQASQPQPAKAERAPEPEAPPTRAQPVTSPQSGEGGASAGGTSRLAELQRSITRIYEACQAPPLPPSEYQLLFTLIAAEVREHGFAPNRSAESVISRAGAAGLKLSAQDVGFVINAVDEIDPWLEHTRSPAAVARAYRDYVLTRCSQVGLDLTDDEYQLIQVWFGASQWTGASGNNSESGQAQTDASGLTPRPELGLPGPSTRADLPVPDNFGVPAKLEADLERQQREQAANLRYSFLKHG
ncbi:MAG: NYN domain-containing protein [Hyphomicrobiales bacterium]|nr:NYN domain-containing protein [Hyphomicrobiales bacterium]